MKRLALIALALLSLSALAQQRPSDDELNAAMQTLQAQRNEEANKVVNLTMVVAKLQKQLADVQAQCKKGEPKEAPKK